MLSWIEAYGLPGLFAVSFLAATLFPLSSEAALAAGLTAGVPVVPAIVACSLGNSLACLVNYGLGRLLAPRMEKRLRDSRAGRKTLGWMHRYGPASLLLSWAPVVGDPLTVAAGLARVPFFLFLILVVPLRVGRYLLIGAVL